MFVRANVAFETPTHNIAAGQLVDLPEAQAVKAIAEGKAVAATVDDAIREMSADPEVERAVASPMKRKG
jgi:hypothetical protein